MLGGGTRARLGLALRTEGSLDDALQMAAHAEAAGVHTLYIDERHFDSEAAGGFANPFAVAAAASARLERAWIAVTPAVGLEHPLRTVEQANVLDLLAHGRSMLILSDLFDERAYHWFGAPVPRNGLFADLTEHMQDAWSWQYQADGPPLEFSSGRYSAKMAGRIMPSPCRRPHPRLARATSSVEGACEAARRGWSLVARGSDPCRLLEAYRANVVAEVEEEDAARWLIAAVDVSADALDNRLTETIDRLTACGADEVRLDLEAGVSLQAVLPALASLGALP
jgi:alkanesulfonate monooxygenase SsuD/methylene tetrahydromethanopterin reductase-like flavin-dependent oxidoreductase (luciferase family)